MPPQIHRLRIYQTFRAWLKRVHVWNTTASLYHVLKNLVTNVLQFDIDQRATAVAYTFTLAIFPAIIFLFTLIPYIPIQGLDAQIIDFLEKTMPRGIFDEAEATIRDIVGRRRGGVLSVGFGIAVYSSMSGMLALMRAFNLTQRTRERRGFFRTRAVALLLTFLLAFVLLVALGVLILGRFVLDELMYADLLDQDSTYTLIEWSSYFTVFSVLLVAVSCIYYFAPALVKKWKFFNAGSVLASLMIVLITNGFSYYLSYFSTYNRLYGAVGTLIALMVWLYLVALVLILGFEINHSTHQVREDM